MKSTVLAVLLGAVCATALIGPATASLGKGEARTARFVERMAERLSLTDTQRTQLETILREQNEKRRALRKETNARIEGMLTPEQRERLAQSRAARKAGRKGRRAQRREQQQ